MSFSATTSAMTVITQRAMEEEGQSYDTLLPAELRRKRSDARKNQTAPTVDEHGQAVVKAYVYADGTVSQQYDAQRARIKLNRLQDKSGFDWKAGYSPNNDVKKLGWDAGFDQNGVWTQFKTANPQTENRGADISMGTPTESNVRYLFVDNELYLDDRDGLLSDGETSDYYDVQGQLYGQVGTDRLVTAERLIQTAASQGCTRIAGIISRKTADQYRVVYGPLFGDMVTDQTRLYPAMSPEAISMEKLVQEQTQRHQSAMAATEVRALAGAGLTKDAIMAAMAAPPATSIIEIGLNLQKSSDIAEFLSLPELADDNPMETTEYVASLPVPEVKRAAFGNAVSNLLAARPTMLTESGLTTKELIQAVYDRVVDGKNTPRTIQNVVSLYDLLQTQGYRQSQTGGLQLRQAVIPRFGEALGPRSDEITWETLPEASRPLVQAMREQAVHQAGGNQAAAAKIQQTLSFALSQYPTIAASTGLRPTELAEAAVQVATNQADAAAFKRKRVVYERSLDDLIDEASLANYQTRRQTVAELTGSSQWRAATTVPLSTVAADLGAPVASADLEALVLPALDDLEPVEAEELKIALQQVDLKRGQLDGFIKQLRAMHQRDQVVRRSTGSTKPVTAWIAPAVNRAAQQGQSFAAQVVPIASETLASADLEALVLPALDILEPSETAEIQAALRTIEIKRGELDQFVGRLRQEAGRYRGKPAKTWIKRAVSTAQRSAKMNTTPVPNLGQQRMANPPLLYDVADAVQRQRFLELPEVKQAGVTEADIQQLVTQRTRTSTLPSWQTQSVVNRELATVTGQSMDSSGSWRQRGPAWLRQQNKVGNARWFPLGGQSTTTLPEGLRQQVVYDDVAQASTPTRPATSPGVSQPQIVSIGNARSPHTGPSLEFATPAGYVRQRGGTNPAMGMPGSEIGAMAGVSTGIPTSSYPQDASTAGYNSQGRPMPLPGQATSETSQRQARIEANYEQDRRALAKADDGGGGKGPSSAGGGKSGGNVTRKLMDDILHESDQMIDD